MTAVAQHSGCNRLGRSVAERARQALRGLMPRNAYHALARLYGGGIAAYRVGPSQYRRLARLRTAHRGSEPAAFQVPGISHAVYLRPGTTDAHVLENNLIRCSYSCCRPETPVFLIIDAGANAGYAAVYFLNRFPDADVFALEPDPANYELARTNLAPYGRRVTLLRAALWPFETPLRILTSAREDAVKVEPGAADDGACQGVDPLRLLRESGHDRIGLFKCDIEGAEEVLFAGACDPWLERTDAAVVEIHSAAAKSAVYAAMQRHRFRPSRYRDLHVFVR